MSDWLSPYAVTATTLLTWLVGVSRISFLRSTCIVTCTYSLLMPTLNSEIEVLASNITSIPDVCPPCLTLSASKLYQEAGLAPITLNMGIA